MKLTYAITNENLIYYLSPSDIKAAINQAYSRWDCLIPVSFSEMLDCVTTHIKIGFYIGDLDDKYPLDGPHRVLAYASAAENGGVHFDATKTWAVDFRLDKSRDAIDL
ncbi:hypothetical protein GIB67_001179 [Kingdonia uniflora]|uniref:Peptidase M10 metallopeptidase domain-containing protein n=1 Tax=Kingdonia uniflora TaxID=39325 RepID=A0A7J7LG57_9MAGN|nr:hypothetical protein GIB67_001179 [Kingdonia uniflora]